MSNGVRQGSVLSPFLFAVYLDGLLVGLSQSSLPLLYNLVLSLILQPVCVQLPSRISLLDTFIMDPLF